MSHAPPTRFILQVAGLKAGRGLNGRIKCQRMRVDKEFLTAGREARVGPPGELHLMRQ